MWNILIVDDDFGTRKILNRILARRALADHAVNGREALTAYELSQVHAEPYDAILLDVTMPEMDGMEVLLEIRRRESARGIPTGKGVPVIMITGRDELQDQALKSGCDDFLVKPVSPSMLLDKIKKYIPA